jgi:hypothetical protein
MGGVRKRRVEFLHTLFIDDCKTNVRVSLFRANLEKCFVSRHDFSRAEKGPVGRGL